MGAEFFVILVPWPQQITPEVIQRLHEKVDMIGDDIVNYISEWIYPLDQATEFQDLEEQLGDDGLTDAYLEREAAKLILHKVVDRFVPKAHTFRDTHLYQLNGVSYMISGGMSYGDAPTESYRELEWLNASGIMDEFEDA